MTYEQYVKEANEVFLESKGTYRIGQAYFNTLYDYRPDLSEQVRATSIDPFYQDELLLPFLQFVEANW